VQAGLKDYGLSGKTLKIFGNQPTNPYLSILMGMHIEVVAINKEAEDLETFFMQMIGGHAS
jgi:hypothetical protein